MQCRLTKNYQNAAGTHANKLVKQAYQFLFFFIFAVYDFVIFFFLDEVKKADIIIPITHEAANPIIMPQTGINLHATSAILHISQLAASMKRSTINA